MTSPRPRACVCTVMARTCFIPVSPRWSPGWAALPSSSPTSIAFRSSCRAARSSRCGSTAQTINQVFGTAFDVRGRGRSLPRPHRRSDPPFPQITAEHLMAAGSAASLRTYFSARYTTKMWALELEDLDATVVKRIPIRFDDEDRYFPDDRYQLLPREGYAAAFHSILDHPNISVSLSMPFDRVMLAEYRVLLQQHADRRVLRFRTRCTALSFDPLSSSAGAGGLWWCTRGGSELH